MGSFHLCLGNKGHNLFRVTLNRFPPLLNLCPGTLLTSELFLVFSRSRSRERDRSLALEVIQVETSHSLSSILLLVFHNAAGLSTWPSCECDLWRVYKRRMGLFLAPRNRSLFTSHVFAAYPGATKSSLLSAPSIVSMFVPAPEEFTDEQPTVMTDK